MKSPLRNLLNGKLTDLSSRLEFNQQHYIHLYERIKLVSYMLIFTYPCFFIVDFVWFRNLHKPLFKLFLEGVHLTGFVISILFIYIYHRFSKRVSHRLFVNGYVFLYLWIGAVSSLNSQLFTGNIYAYIIILLGVAAIFPIRPRDLLVHYAFIHTCFLIGLRLMEPSHFAYLSMLINSTGTAVISFTIALAFYSFRENDFVNKRRLSKSEEGFRRLFNMNPNPLILANFHDDKIILMNNKASEHFHFDPKHSARLDTQFLFQQPEEWKKIKQRLTDEKCIKNYVSQSNLCKWAMLHFELVDYLDSTCILIDTTDITAMKQREEELYHYASVDTLTGVKNRRYGMELLHNLISADAQTEEFILSYIDINNLKTVNDRFGHAVGDDLIKTCCDTIHKQLDLDDVLFRLGGDEFIMIFFNKQMSEVQLIWKHIEQAFKEINASQQRPYQLSMSHGHYHFIPGTSITVDEMIACADQEMYKKKAILKKHPYLTK